MFALTAPAACFGDEADAGRGDRELVIYNAGSLARPMRALADSFAAIHDVAIAQESAGSLETARKLTELGKTPDIIALADHEIFPRLLIPRYTSWYVRFAHNRMVIAYTDRSRLAARIDSSNWWSILTREGVEVGRSDPDLDPNGYRTLLVFQLAERHYDVPGLAERLLENAPWRNVRPKEMDLVALLEAGELDYIWSYESVARATGLRHVELPAAIDLSNPDDSATYAAASVRVAGATPTDRIVIVGAPIVYGVSIPVRAPHHELAELFMAFMLSAKGRRVMRGEALDPIDPPVLVGDAVPRAISDATVPP